MNRGRWLIDQLPVSMLDDDFLVRFLSIFQDVADTFMHQVDTLEHQIDASVTPESMVRYLGAWLGARSIDSSLDEETQRRIVREHGRMLPWRGTIRGLRMLLEMVTGASAVVTDTGGVYREGAAPENGAHVHIEVMSLGWATDDDLVALVQAEMPASVTFELEVAGRRLWPEPDLVSAILNAPRSEVVE